MQIAKMILLFIFCIVSTHEAYGHSGDAKIVYDCDLGHFRVDDYEDTNKELSRLSTKENFKRYMIFKNHHFNDKKTYWNKKTRNNLENYFWEMTPPKDINVDNLDYYHLYYPACVTGGLDYTEVRTILGTIYYHGLGMLYNPKEAFLNYEKAANDGYMVAQYYLGQMYYIGEYAQQDYKKAFNLFLSSAKQGYTRPLFFISSMLFEGKGTKKDHQEACKFYIKALIKDNSFDNGKFLWLKDTIECEAK